MSFYSINLDKARIIRKAWNCGVRRKLSSTEQLKFDVYGLGKGTVWS
jgi:hypothetical protein